MTFDFIDRADYEAMTAEKPCPICRTPMHPSAERRHGHCGGSYCEGYSDALPLVHQEVLRADSAVAEFGRDPDEALPREDGEARAARGEWSSLGPLCPVCSDVAGGYGDEPDPTHTPAVRRVLAWAVPGVSGPFESEGVAYEMAARARMWGHDTSGASDRFRRRVDEAPSPQRYADRVRQRLAAYLRHRDEKAGRR